MEILSSSDHSKLTRLFFERFLSVLEKLSSQEEIFVGLSGGSSLDIFYACIQSHFREIPEEIRTKIRFAFLDERVVSVDHPDSNEGQLRKKFLDALVEDESIGEKQIIGIKISDPHIADEYTKRVPRIDLALLGVGPDGHIASLFPHHPLLSSVETGYLEITDSPKPPAHRITVSPMMIREISYTFIAFMGGKEQAFADFRDSEKSVQDCPAKMTISDRTVVMSDIDL